MNRCTYETHAAMRADVDRFQRETEGGFVWAGNLLMANCRSCSSTLCLYTCVLCTAPCSSEDCLPWGKGDTDAHAHFACVAKAMLAKHRTKFVILVGGKQAREFVRP